LGAIRVGGHDLRDVTPESWARIVGFVPQENKLIRGTVSENIAFHRPFDRAAIERASRSANLYDEIMMLPDGFDTEIGPGARDLSGGQKQRLGIARALVAEPMLLILDEPTSALDGSSETLISEAIERLRGTATVVIVAHRLETLAVCDRVITLSRVLSASSALETAVAVASAN
jgi:ABC-type multidrug transport system fused ATPase/permease subunit